jgi:F0F1-type ATP synthase assembly protein I
MATEAPSWQKLLGIGAVVAVTLVAGILLGLLVDSLAGTTPVFLFVGLLIGLVAAGAYAVTTFRQYLKH